MKNTHIGIAGFLILIITPLVVIGASAGYKALVLEQAQNAWNYSNDKIVSLEKEIALERKLEVENFCFLVETKKDQDLSISPESIARHETDCLGL